MGTHHHHTAKFKVEILAQQLKLSFIILNNSHIASLILVRGGSTDALRAVQVSLYDKVVIFGTRHFLISWSGWEDLVVTILL